MSQIRQALSERTLLLTGVTGFFAKALLAKLLGDVPDLRRVYLLIRPGSASREPAASVQGRLQREILDSSAFLPLRQRYREAFPTRVAGKLFPLAGDLSLDRFGWDAASYAQVAGELDLIINSAASVSFDERLDQALELNTFGPGRLLDLARAGGDIPLVQISTAYVCGDREALIPEEPPEVGMTPAARQARRDPLDLNGFLEELRQVCRELAPQGEPEAAHQALVAEGLARARALGWHDVYTMTKALGEQLLVRDRGGVPLCLLRPSVIESGLREPQPGWLDGLRMADPLFVAYGRGEVRDFPIDPLVGLDLVPVDLVVNATLAATAALLREGGLAVYHVATGDVTPLQLGQLGRYLCEYFLRCPLRDRQGRPVRVAPWRYLSREQFERRYRRRRLAPLRILRQALGTPALAPLRRRLQPPITARISALENLLYLADLYAPYTHLRYTFETRRFRALAAGLEPGDRARFPCEATEIAWRDYVQDVHLPGLKHFVLRIEDVPGAGLAKWEALRVAPRMEPEDPDPEVRTIRDLLLRAAARYKGGEALEFKQGERYVQYSFQEASRLAALLGERLLAQGVGAGDRVGLLAENRPEWAIGYLGAVSQGMIVVPLDPKLPEAELEGLLRQTGARALLCSELRLQEMSSALLQRLGGPGGGIALLDLSRFGTPLPGFDPPARPRGTGREPGPDDVASILFTSGTTVAPKGVMLSHRNFLANVRAAVEFLGVTPQDRLLSVLPLHHAFEFTCGCLGPLWVGARVSYLPSVNSAEVLAAMRERGITLLLGVPRLYQLLAQGIEQRVAAAGRAGRLAARALSGLARAAGMRARRALFWQVHRALGGRIRLLVSGGAPLDPELFDRFRSLGFTLCEGYGLTETAPVLTVNPPDRPRRGSVGLPLPGVELRIIRPDSDGVGEIVARGPNVMSGYFGQPELTASALRDGWLHTGDLGRLDAEGYLYITGRLKEVIVTPAGKTIYPDEVEALYRDLPGVLESCVVGMPSPGGNGEEVHLVVVPDGAAGLDQAEILRRVDARSQAAPSHRRVQHVHFLSGELPKTTTLKVKRGEVRCLLQAAMLRRTDHRAEEGGRLGALTPPERAMLALIARLASVLPGHLAPDAHLERDLGFDSLMRVEILAFLDSLRGQPVPEEWAAHLSTVGDVLTLVRRQAGRLRGRGRPTRVTWRHLLEQPANVRSGGLPMPSPRLFRATLRATRGLLTRYCRLACRGHEYLPREGPFLLAANHASHLDAFAVLVALGDRASEVSLVGARDYFFNWAWQRLLLPRALPIIPFDREGDFLQGLRLCREAIRRGRSLLIFPEGTRSRTDEMQPFKAGVGVLAVELGIPLIPTAIEGTQRALPKGRWFPRRQPLRVSFGPPVLPGPPRDGDEHGPYEHYRAVVARLRAAIEALRASAPFAEAASEGPGAGRRPAAG